MLRIFPGWRLLAALALAPSIGFGQANQPLHTQDARAGPEPGEQVQAPGAPQQVVAAQAPPQSPVPPQAPTIKPPSPDTADLGVWSSPKPTGLDGNKRQATELDADRKLFGTSALEGEDDLAKTAGNPRNWILQTVTALAIVVGLILLLRRVIAKMNARPLASSHSPIVQVLSRVSVAPRNHILIVRLDRRILVLGDSPNGLTTLANIEDGEEVAAILQAITAAKPNSISRSFSQLLTGFNAKAAEDQANLAELTDSSEYQVDRTRNQLSGLLSRLRAMGRGIAT